MLCFPAAGLSLALGAFLAGLLIAETEYALQVESDIAPYKGLLMGLFFMTVGEYPKIIMICMQNYNGLCANYNDLHSIIMICFVFVKL